MSSDSMSGLLCDNKKCLIAAIDHYPVGPLPGLENPLAVLEDLVAGPADAIVASFGVLKAYKKQFAEEKPRPTLILRADGNETYLHGAWTSQPHWRRFSSVADAESIGAQGLAVNLVLGGPSELESLTVTSRLAGETYRHGLELVVTVVVVDLEDPGRITGDVERVAFGCRVAAELGADLVCIYYSGPVSALTMMPGLSFIPVLVTGLGKLEAGSAPAHDLTTAMQAGFAGACVGRGLWQAPDTRQAVRFARQVVHKGCEHD